MKFSNKSKNIFLILLSALFIRFILSFFGTLQLDHGTFVSWSLNLAENGLRNFYNGWSDYLPGYLYILQLLGKLNLTGFFPQVVLYKLPAIIADVVTGYLIYKILEIRKSSKLGIIGAILYVFNPAVFANSSLWGQVDSLTALASLAAVYLLNVNYLLSAAAISIGTLIKPQAAFALPVIMFLFVQQRRRLVDFLNYCLIGLVIFVIAFIPFSSGNIIDFIINRLGLSANQYPYTSINAFNFWGLFGFWKPDNLIFQFGSYAVVTIILLLLCFKNIKNKNISYSLLAFVFSASFMFFTRMHERHLLPVFAPLVVAAVENPIFLIPYLGFSSIYVFNLVYSYHWITNDFLQIFPDFLVKVIILVGIGLTVSITYWVIKNKKISWAKMISKTKNIFRVFTTKPKKQQKIIKFAKTNLSNKQKKAILVIILIFAFATRIYKLNEPSDMYFDEVYHAFTARVMMAEDRAKAWEWWNTPPDGFAYEWTHPPLAKLGMILGMKVFGQNAFGWRFPGAILGVGSVFVIYLIAKKIFNDDTIGLISAGVFAMDGLPLVSSRIGMNDSYFLFFALLSIYLFMRGGEPDFKTHFAHWDLFSALAYGLALSSKWSALWAAPIIFILWLKRREKFKLSILWFLLLPPIVYLLSYLPMFTTGHNIDVWWGMQQQMWWYHTKLDATHPYSSPWWTWPFLIRPVYLYTSDEIRGLVSRIYMMGNPFVFWFGVVAVMMSSIYAYIERNKKIGFVIFSYLIFFAPWAVSPRIMFFYHYLPSIPFLAIAIGYFLRRNSKFILGYFVVGLLIFIYFYPHWAGLQVPLWLDKSYYWLASWR